MNIIPLFLPDFRDFVRNRAFNSMTDIHPVFYFETEEAIYFYKPIEYVIYSLTIKRSDLLQDTSYEDLRQELINEFMAYEIPAKLDAPKIVTNTIV